MTECGYRWIAPYLHADGKKTPVEQVCVLSRGHEGDHRSWTKVTKARVSR